MPVRDELAIQPIPSTANQDDEGKNLADLILEKIAAHEAATVREPKIQGGGPPEKAVELPAKVVEVYSK